MTPSRRDGLFWYGHFLQPFLQSVDIYHDVDLLFLRDSITIHFVKPRECPQLSRLASALPIFGINLFFNVYFYPPDTRKPSVRWVYARPPLYPKVLWRYWFFWYSALLPLPVQQSGRNWRQMLFPNVQQRGYCKVRTHNHCQYKRRFNPLGQDTDKSFGPSSPNYNSEAAHLGCLKRLLLDTLQWQSARLMVGLPVCN